MMQVATHLDAEVVALATDDRTSGSVADVLVDTDVFIDHIRGAKQIKVGRNRLHYSVVTRAELVAGTSASDLINQLLDPFRELVVDRAVAERAGRIRRESGVRLPDAGCPDRCHSGGARDVFGHSKSAGLRRSSRPAVAIGRLTRRGAS